MNWYRVELDYEGAVVACQFVVRQEFASRYIFFIRAENEQEAIAKLQAKRERRMANNREKSNRYYQERRESGLCTACGKAEPEPGLKRCIPCRDNHRAVCERLREEGSTRVKPTTPEEHAAAEMALSSRAKIRDLSKYEQKKATGWRPYHDHWRKRGEVYQALLTRLRSDGAEALERYLEELIAECATKAVVPERGSEAAE